MGDAGDEYEAISVVDGIDKAIVADANPKVVSARKLEDTRWPGIDRQAVNDRLDPVAKRAVQSPVLASGRRLEADLVVPLRRSRYSRTSAHETVRSRSSRAWRAARLSSRYSRRSSNSA